MFQKCSSNFSAIFWIFFIISTPYSTIHSPHPVFRPLLESSIEFAYFFHFMHEFLSFSPLTSKQRFSKVSAKFQQVFNNVSTMFSPKNANAELVSAQFMQEIDNILSFFHISAMFQQCFRNVQAIFQQFSSNVSANFSELAIQEFFRIFTIKGR